MQNAKEIDKYNYRLKPFTFMNSSSVKLQCNPLWLDRLRYCPPLICANFQPFAKRLRVLSTPKERAFENIVRKGENAGIRTMKIFFFSIRFISVIFVVQRECTLSISVSTGEPVSVESKIVRVVSLGTTEIYEIT